jgi:hypothetical protein
MQGTTLRDQLQRGWGRVEFIELSHHYSQLTPLIGGGRGIRTPGTVSGSVVFKTTAIDHSAIPPRSHFIRIPPSGARRMLFLDLDQEMEKGRDLFPRANAHEWLWRRASGRFSA